MGILERKIQEKIEEQQSSFEIISQVQNTPAPQNPQINPKVQKNFSILRDRVDKYIDKFYEIETSINKNLQVIPEHYNLKDISTKFDQMIEELKELRQIYLNGENGMIDLKLAFIKEAEASQVPTPVWNVRNNIAMLFSLLKNMWLDSQVSDRELK